MTQIKINYELEALLLLLKNEKHGRELAKEMKTSLTRVQAILNRLREFNVLDYRTEGRNHVYFIKRNIVAKAYILNAENYKLAKLLRRYPFLEPLFRDIAEKCPDKMAVLFGSYAKFSPKDDSDIDLYIGTIDKKIKMAVDSINEKISAKIGEFSKEDLLIQEIIKDHIIIQGGELFYEKLGFFK